MPAVLPVLPLAALTAVERDQAAAAGMVRGASGDGSLGGAAVGAVADGGRGGGTFFLAFLALALAFGVGAAGAPTIVASSGSHLRGVLYEPRRLDGCTFIYARWSPGVLVVLSVVHRPRAPPEASK